MFIARVVAFTVALLLLSQSVEPAWGWYLALWLGGLLSFTILSLAAALMSLGLATGVFETSEAWHIVLVVFTLVALLRGLLRPGVEGSRALAWYSRRTSRTDV